MLALWLFSGFIGMIILLKSGSSLLDKPITHAELLAGCLFTILGPFGLAASIVIAMWAIYEKCNKIDSFKEWLDAPLFRGRS